MAPRLWHILATAGLALGVLAGVVFGIDAIRQHQGAGAEHNAAVASGEANAHQHNAQAQDAAIADLQAQRKADKANLDRVASERDALLRKLAAIRQSNSHSAGDDPSPTQNVGSDDSALEAAEAVIAKDAEVIEAQANFIEGQKTEISALTISRNEWKATAEARERQALAQEAATEAWKKAVTTSKWRGRIEGFAAGVALGYVARGQR